MEDELILFLERKKGKSMSIETCEYLESESIIVINKMNYEIDSDVLFLKDELNEKFISINIKEIVKISYSDNILKVYLDSYDNSYIIIK